ncbi:HAD family hydrolase [Kocuria sp.]|uniref:HAD family hydrolase n=1 Tax=Kocuria sp. TaxID=1871328 RepID=UPI0026E07361|nr:HAD family hydrolase [Kocuria sp.]MDO5618271.1 HAD family hydrolase [Kocuria sp.]
MDTRKVIFLDVDGTLVDYHNNIPESARVAIREARNNGHLVLMSTGRSRAEVYPELWEIGLDGLIGGNGSYVEFQGQVVLEQTMAPQQCRAVVDWLTERGLEFYLECNAGLYGSPRFQEVAQPTIRQYARTKGNAQADHLTVGDVFPDMIFGADLVRSDVNKISFVLNSYADHTEATAAFPDLKSGTWGGRGGDALFGDLGVANISKAVAIEQLVKHVGVDIAHTIGFGDATVDIPMLEICGVGVAMGNGSQDVKAVADHITDDVEEDGLANAFRHLGLID